eukprot:9468506-Pyramimonas_sp.AAC.1
MPWSWTPSSSAVSSSSGLPSTRSAKVSRSQCGDAAATAKGVCAMKLVALGSASLASKTSAASARP